MKWVAGFWVLFVPGIAVADINGSVLLSTNMTLNMESGAVSAAGGDFLWDGNNLNPQAASKIGGPFRFGITDFAAAGQNFWTAYQSRTKSVGIPAAKLTTGSVVVVVTASGHLGAAFIASSSGGALWLIYKTFGASGVPGLPIIGQISNNSSFIAPLQPNYGVAPSSIIAISGTNLSDAGKLVLQSTTPPGLPLTLNGTSVAVTINGVTTHPALYYASPGGLAVVLPAATPAGSGTLTVTYRGNTSAPAPIQVFPSQVGINFYLYNSGVATDAKSGKLITFGNSATPGEKITLWTTGLGADPADSDTTYTSTPHAINASLQIFIGGLPATILYQGASTYPGVDQINVTIPAGVTEGCWVSVVAQTGNITSNSVTIPIQSGGGDCVDSVSGLTGNQVYPPQRRSLKSGLVELVHSTTVSANGSQTTSNSTDAAFEKYTGLNSPGEQVSPGSCVIVPIVPNVPSSLTGLDSGKITLSGPNALSVTLNSQPVAGAFFANLSATAIPSTGGTFTFTGAGGADVGPFMVSLTLANPLLTVTVPPPAAVDRTQSMPVSWTGGNPGSFVAITGTSRSTVTGAIGAFTCVAPVSPGQFTVPSYVLLGLPAGEGGTDIQNLIFGAFNATGLDIGVIGASVSFHPGAIKFQ